MGLIRFAQILIFMFALLGGLPSAYANVHVLPEKIEDLGSPLEIDPLVRVAGTKIAYVNFAALRRDFPTLAAWNDSQIEGWVLENFSFVSQEQLKLSHVRNSVIPLAEPRASENERLAYRPLGYERAAILPAFDGASGLVDIKGIGNAYASEKVDKQFIQYLGSKNSPQGMDKLRTSSHSDGLMSLGEAVAELDRQTAVQRLFDLYNAKHGLVGISKLETVETYFILSLPIDILKTHGERVPAALYGRQAHLGRRHNLTVPREIYEDFEGGMQQDGFHSAVDFGGVIIRDPRLQGAFGPLPGRAASDAQGSKVWAYGHDVASAFTRANDPDPYVVYRHLEDEMLAPIRADWEKIKTTPQYLETQRRHGFRGVLTQFLLSTDKKTREAASTALARDSNARFHQKDEEFFSKALNDPDTSVRAAAARSLLLYRGPGKQAFLAKALSDESFVQKYAARSLEGYSGPGAEALFERALASGFPDVREAAAKALEGYSGPRSDELFRKALTDPFRTVRLAAQVSMHRNKTGLLNQQDMLSCFTQELTATLMK